MSNKHLPRVNPVKSNLLRNAEGDMAFVVNQPEALKHLNGMIGTCTHYSHIINQWYFDVPGGGTYMFRDDELVPLGGEDLRYTEPRLVLKTGAVVYA